MDESKVPDERIHGLTLYLFGIFDPEKMAKVIPLRSLRLERSRDNAVTICHRGKPPTVFHPNRRIEIVQLKLSVEAEKSISALFDGLIDAIERAAKRRSFGLGFAQQAHG